MRMARVGNIALLGALLFGGEGDEVCCYEIDDQGNVVTLWCESDVLPLSVLACIAPPPQPEGLTQPRITLKNIAEKSVPIVEIPDADKKDLRLLKGKFPETKEKRGRLVAKKPDASGAWAFDLGFGGLYRASAQFAYDATTGFVDGASEAWFEVRGLAQPEGEGTLPFTRVTLTWDAGAGAFEASAENESGPLGTPFTFSPETDHLELAITRTVDELTVEAFGAGFIEDGAEGFGFFHTEMTPPVPGLYQGVFGADGLDKGSTLWVPQLMVEAFDLEVQSATVPAAMNAAASLEILEQAAAQFSNPFLDPSPADIAQRVELALDCAVNVTTFLEQRIEDGDLELTPAVKRSLKSAKTLNKRCSKADKLADKLATKSNPKVNALRKRTFQAWWSARVLLAQQFGFKSKSIDKLFDTVDIDLGGL